MFTGITFTARQEISLEESSASSEVLELSEEEANDASEGREILPSICFMQKSVYTRLWASDM